MRMTIHPGETRGGEPLAELRLDGKIIVKVYPSPDSEKIRIMLPEFSSFKQIELDIDHFHMITFTRKVPHE
jgi:hypothetical protein